jgi:ADP-heptose:LPS heptosyltransferase
LKKPFRRILLLLIRLLGLPGASFAARRARRPATKQPRILLVHPGPLGALVLTTPVLHALKTALPDARITMAAGPWASEVVANHPDLDQLVVVNFPSYRRTSPKGLQSYLLLFRCARQLRREHYDLAINLHRNFWWGALLLYLARVPRRIGYAVQPATPFLTRALPFGPQEHAAVSRLLAASAGLQALGAPPLAEPYTPERYPLRCTPTDAEQRWAADYLRSKGISPKTLLVVIHPGTSVEVKQWRPEGWAACATELERSWSGDLPVRFLLTGTGKELPLLEEIARGTAAQTTIAVETSVGQLAALLRRAQLVLGVDSGPLHLAVAQQTPTVQIFGPTDPRRYKAWGRQEKHSTVVTTHRCPSCPSLPCGRLHFQPQELASHPCVRLVSVHEVLAAIFKMAPHIKPPEGGLVPGGSAYH